MHKFIIQPKLLFLPNAPPCVILYFYTYLSGYGIFVCFYFCLVEVHPQLSTKFMPFVSMYSHIILTQHWNFWIHYKWFTSNFINGCYHWCLLTTLMALFHRLLCLTRSIIGNGLYMIIIFVYNFTTTLINMIYGIGCVTMLYCCYSSCIFFFYWWVNTIIY